MLLKPGVDISKLKRPIRRILNDLDTMYTVLGETLTITSTYEGSHMPSSLHYSHEAIDINLPDPYYWEFEVELRGLIPSDFDFVIERDHIHIEYDPKT